MEEYWGGREERRKREREGERRETERERERESERDREIFKKKWREIREENKKGRFKKIVIRVKIEMKILKEGGRLKYIDFRCSKLY